MSHYKAIKVNGVKRDLHRHIVETYLGKKLPYNKVVHHIDGDKLNNDPDNLEIMTRAKHARLHQTGKKLSTETKRKIRKAKRATRVGASLSVEQIQIVKMLLHQGAKQSAIARSFSVSKFCIWKIKNGRNSKWIKAFQPETP